MSPSRKNLGTIGSTIKSLADTQVSVITPDRSAASCASPLNCQVVSVSGTVNSIVRLPSLSDTKDGRKNAVSTRFFRGGGGAVAKPTTPGSLGPRSICFLPSSLFLLALSVNPPPS